MPATPVPAKKQPLTLEQLAAYDDFLTDALVDHVFYWTTIPKNRPSYHASRGLKEDVLTKIVQQGLIINQDLAATEAQLLATDGLKKFYNTLKTPKEKDDFRQHLRRYMRIYLPDCPFEVTSTNRYTITTHEASITARRLIKKNEPIKYLSGVQVIITPEEEKILSRRKKDFSIVVSARSKCASLFMGPARFANHDCGANARLMTTGQAGIEIIAKREIDVGEEITVEYSDSYFGEDNCECLCQTCEDNLTNGWKQEVGVVAPTKSVEESLDQGYSLRRRRRDDSVASDSRTPSVTPDIRPKIRKSRSQILKSDSSMGSPSQPLAIEAASRLNRKRQRDSLTTPPITPAKRQKTTQYEVEPLAMSRTLSQTDSDVSSLRASASESGEGPAALTDASTPEEASPAPMPHSPVITPAKSGPSLFKEEDTEPPSLIRLPSFDPSNPAGDVLTPNPIPSIEAVPSPEKAQPDIIVTAGVHGIAPDTHKQRLTQPGQASANYRAGSCVSSCGRGRPQVTGKESSPPPHTRTPRDYTLTPLLLSEPHTAWIHCTICNAAFVQRDAYYTRSSCPRCERHSKLYGYLWPKTQPVGKYDKEPRVLDHRTVHRFLDADDEAIIRGRKRSLRSTLAGTPVGLVAVGDLPGDRSGGDEESDDAGLRRSGRRRNPSARVAIS